MSWWTPKRAAGCDERSNIFPANADRQELADLLQMSRCVTADSDAAPRLETARKF